MNKKLNAPTCPGKGSLARMDAGYWLPEEYTLNLNALEVGWLLALVYVDREDCAIAKRGPRGKPIATTVRACLQEKIQAAMRATERSGLDLRKPRPVSAGMKPGSDTQISGAAKLP